MSGLDTCSFCGSPLAPGLFVVADGADARICRDCAQRFAGVWAPPPPDDKRRATNLSCNKHGWAYMVELCEECEPRAKDDGSDRVDEALRVAARAFVAALPKCSGAPTAEGGWLFCQKPATRGYYLPRDAAPNTIACDDCEKRSPRHKDPSASGRFVDLPGAVELRALVAALEAAR